MSRPPNIRRPITIYTRITNTLTNQARPIRRVLHNVFWAGESNNAALNTGQILNQSLFIQCFIEDNLEYIDIHEWAKLSELDIEGKWSVDDRPQLQSIVVPYIVEHEFSWGTVSQTTSSESNFIHDNPGTLRVAKVEPRLIGTPRVHHISIRC